MRYNNETNNLEAVWFPNFGWIYNLDSNYATNLPTTATNPLKLEKRVGITRLHVFVDAGNSNGIASQVPRRHRRRCYCGLVQYLEWWDRASG